MNIVANPRGWYEQAFEALTEYRPFPWQVRLFEQLLAGQVPRTVTLPTGLGKTSVIVVWLLALVHQLRAAAPRLPRRLVYIVNRRTVVDQATSVVEGMRDRLRRPAAPPWRRHRDVLASVGDSLRGACAVRDEPALGVSTLRGELADNEEWKSDPARPAIVIGTIDMIGSRLLFSGYGDGRNRRALHAGLLGHDSLIVHDEAHLTPAFSVLLESIVRQQQSVGNQKIRRPMQVMELSATARNGGGATFGLQGDDELDPVVRQRTTAAKHLRLHEPAPDDEKALVGRIAALALRHESGDPCRVLIYVRTPERAAKVIDALRKALKKSGAGRISLLTGTIRGFERDRLVREDPVFQALMDGEGNTPQTVYLVSTSAGEVGIDLDADHMVCDLTSLDALLQRLGRVNRRGGAVRVAQVDVVPDPSPGKAGTKKRAPAPFEESIARTREILEQWQQDAGGGPIDVSPREIELLLAKVSGEVRKAAFSPAPAMRSLTDVLFDAWSLTSVDRDMPGRPPVAEFLHGVTHDPPETFVAWRREVSLLAESEVGAAGCTVWFKACPIRSHERLRDRSAHVHRSLRELYERLHKQDAERAERFQVLLLDERGEAHWRRLAALVGRNEENRLHFRTLVLPVEVGGLSTEGFLSPSALPAAAGHESTASEDEVQNSASPVAASPSVQLDVAHEVGEAPQPRRFHVTQAGWRCLETNELFDARPVELATWVERHRVVLRTADENDEGVEEALVLLAPPRALLAELDEGGGVRRSVALGEHHEQTARLARTIAEKLALPESWVKALELAARHHDDGKAQPLWQYFVRNDGYPDDRDAPEQAWAKGPRWRHWSCLGGYRHELGSLLRVGTLAEISSHPLREVILHLIAAHHGWARPHFDPGAGDPLRPARENEESIIETLRRFAQLQQHYGRWGLAWLEALLKCADVLASRGAAGTNSGPIRPQVAAQEANG